MRGKEEMRIYIFCLFYLKGRRQLEDLSVDERAKAGYEGNSCRVLLGFIWLGIGIDDRLL
jgi:hypothetical protein